MSKNTIISITIAMIMFVIVGWAALNYYPKQSPIIWSVSAIIFIIMVHNLAKKKSDK